MTRIRTNPDEFHFLEIPMDEENIPKKPFALGKKRPQGIEVVDADEEPVMLVYGETQGQARALAESMIRVLNDANAQQRS